MDYLHLNNLFIHSNANQTVFHESPFYSTTQK